MMEAVVFAIAAVIILAGAIGTVGFPNPVHAALSLVATLFGIAVLFVAQNAHFLAAVQVIVYAGAVVILFLFVIMLLGVERSEDLRTDPLIGQRAAGIAVGVLVCAGLLFVLIASSITGAASAAAAFDKNVPDINQIARLLFTDYLFPFEATSVLLIVAVVGAVLLARRRHPIAPGEMVDDGVPPDSFEPPQDYSPNGQAVSGNGHAAAATGDAHEPAPRDKETAS